MEKYDNLCVCVCRCVVKWRARPWRSMTTCVCVCRFVVEWRARTWRSMTTCVCVFVGVWSSGGPGHGEV